MRILRTTLFPPKARWPECSYDWVSFSELRASTLEGLSGLVRLSSPYHQCCQIDLSIHKTPRQQLQDLKKAKTLFFKVVEDVILQWKQLMCSNDMHVI